VECGNTPELMADVGNVCFDCGEDVLLPVMTPYSLIDQHLGRTAASIFREEASLTFYLPSYFIN
jgi:hypothetical protein